MMIKTAFGGIAEFRKWAASHCDVARLLGTRMGLSAQVQQALRHLYERWDGNGMPGDLRGTQIPLAVRLMQVAQDADVAVAAGGGRRAVPPGAGGQAPARCGPAVLADPD
jgi:HD domain-containing protein